MTRTAEPVRHRLRVGGHLDDHWSARFGGLTLTRGGDGTTSLRGVVQDQAALHGLLAKARDLGVPLISVEVDPVPGTLSRGSSPSGARRGSVEPRR